MSTHERREAIPRTRGATHSALRPSGGGGGNPDPQGLENANLTPGEGSMPRTVRTAPITHTDLDVGAGVAGLGQMPEQVRAPAQDQKHPRRR